MSILAWLYMKNFHRSALLGVVGGRRRRWIRRRGRQWGRGKRVRGATVGSARGRARGADVRREPACPASSDGTRSASALL